MKNAKKVGEAIPGYIINITAFGWEPVKGQVKLINGEVINFTETEFKAPDDMKYFKALPEDHSDLYTSSPVLELHYPVVVYQGKSHVTVRLLDNYALPWQRTWLDKLAEALLEQGDDNLFNICVHLEGGVITK